MRLPAHPGAYAIGDCAACGEPALPATAQVAQKQGKYLAKMLRGRAQGKVAKPFAFRSVGMLAYLGGGQALADLPNAQWSGRGAWFFWRWWQRRQQEAPH